MPVETKDTKADPLADLLASGNAELARRADEAAAKDKKDAETVAAEWRVVALLADDLLGPLAAFVPAEPPEDFVKALDADKKAKEFFGTLNRANIYAIVYRLQTAKKPETREKRIKMIVNMLGRGEKFHA